MKILKDDLIEYLAICEEQAQGALDKDDKTQLVNACQNLRKLREFLIESKRKNNKK